MNAPGKEHQWLQQLTGEWESECEMTAEPGKPSIKSKGTEKIRSLGGWWILSEHSGTAPDGTKVTGLMTVGFDPATKRYVGSWIDSSCSLLWRYTGSTDAAGTKLTLETEGPNMMVPGKTAQYREAIEIKSPDRKVFTSSILGDDGKWVTFVTVTATRRKS
jgi:hypothetical protein